MSTPVDGHRQPRGAPFLAALLLRNLARTLRNELVDAGEDAVTLAENAERAERAAAEGHGAEGDGSAAVAVNSTGREEKKRHLQAERYGLPIPDTVLREEEEEERAAAAGEGGVPGEGIEVDGALNTFERARARAAFEGVEEAVIRVVQENMGGIGQYLGDACGW
jgi:chromatin structure-remodeling complex subunit RSC9